MKRSIALAVSIVLATAAAASTKAADCDGCDAGASRTFAFDSKENLTAWTICGDVAIDTSKGRDAKGSMRIGPGGKAVLKLRSADAAGKVELWVYEDGTKPSDGRAYRLGPRWGLAQNDGRLLLSGILYAPYLGGWQGYTAMACDGKDWYQKVFWLGINRTPGWHKWSFDFDAEQGLEVSHNGKELAAIDGDKTRLKGFSSIAIWGDESKSQAQTIWVDDVSVTLGGAVKSHPATAEVDPYSKEAVAADPTVIRPVTVYTDKNAPAVPTIESLPLQQSVSQYGITWTFEKPARVGQFVNGDWYVVGPATITAIDPKPLYGQEIPRRELVAGDKEYPQEKRLRNGFMLNPPANMRVAYDSAIRNYHDPGRIQRLPVGMKPGDSLVSTISMPKGVVLASQLTNKIERGEGDGSPVRTAAILTCVASPQPADAFRPAFCDRSAKTYLARNLKRQLLPAVARTSSMPPVQQYTRFTQRPWVGTCFFGFEEPVENMPQYGREYGRVVGNAALLLCTDLPPAEKEHLLINFVQIGIDLGGMLRSGHPGWAGYGGHGSGRKLPIVLAGLLLGDDQLANVNRSFPKISFGEDEQTAYGDCWTGATVVFAGHSGIDAATGAARSRGHGWGPYEHLPPSQWKEGQNTSESYRRCCTSCAWVAQALALRLLRAEKAWDHDAFRDYADRWMFEDDSQPNKNVKAATGWDCPDWARQGRTWDAFVDQMWAKHRRTLAAPTEDWKKNHDDGYYRAAIAKDREAH